MNYCRFRLAALLCFVGACMNLLAAAMNFLYQKWWIYYVFGVVSLLCVVVCVYCMTVNIRHAWKSHDK